MTTKTPKAKKGAGKAAKQAVKDPKLTNPPLCGSIPPYSKLVGSVNGGDYVVPVGTTETFNVDLGKFVPIGARVNAVWYVPIDLIGGLVYFQKINLDLVDPTNVSLTLQVNQSTQVRIRIHASYVPIAN
jgi:hypothetical protein